MRATYRVQILHKVLGVVRRSNAFWTEADSRDDLAAQIRRRYLARRWWLPDAEVSITAKGAGAVITCGTARKVVATATIERVPS